MRLACWSLLAALLIAATTPALAAPTAAVSAPPAPPASQPRQVEAALARLPLQFEANHGQAPADVRFVARARGHLVGLTATEAVLVLPGVAVDWETPEPVVVRLQLEGASAAPAVEGVDALPGTVNYFRGNDPARWRTGIPTYARVRARDVYPGIDLVYYGNGRRLESDFVVAPGADPSVIRLAVAGAQRVTLDARGDLLLATAAGELRLEKPHVYQEVAGIRRAIDAGYVLRAGGSIGIQVAAYDRARPLVIDPVLGYSTYLGGSGEDAAHAIAIDSAGNAYVTGVTGSPNFPTMSPYQAVSGGGDDVFVAKLNASGSALLYSTYIGGSGDEDGRGIAVDSAGNAYVTGFTTSTNFPTASPYQGASGGGGQDAFVFKLNAGGSALVYSTYLGGSGIDEGRGIAVDSAGNAYVAGTTASANFPTASAAQGTHGGGGNDAFVTKLNPAGGGPVYSTFLGGNDDDRGNGVAVDFFGAAWVTGSTFSTNFPTRNPLQAANATNQDAFVTRIEPDGTLPVATGFSTYLGGNAFDVGNAIAVDGFGDAYLTGITASPNFPVVNALQPAFGGGFNDAFVAKVKGDGSAWSYVTYLGGNGTDLGLAIGVDPAGQPVVAGLTTSTNFPTVNPLSPSLQGSSDAFVAKLAPNGGALLFSTYFGGPGSESGAAVAATPAGDAILAGNTTSSSGVPILCAQCGYGGGVTLGDALMAAFRALTVGAVTDIDVKFSAEATDGVPPMVVVTVSTTVKNNGTVDATGVSSATLVRHPSGGLAVPSAITPQGSCTAKPGAVDCQLGTIGAGGGAVTYVAKYTVGLGDLGRQLPFSISATATVAAPEDADPSNNRCPRIFAVEANLFAGQTIDCPGIGLSPVATSAGEGGGPHVASRPAAAGKIGVRITDPTQSFFAYDAGFRGGVRVAVGDVNGDGTKDLITAPGPGGGPHVKVFSGTDGSLLMSFLAYDAGFTGGVYVAAGDVNGDGKADIVTGAGVGGGSHVQVFSGADGSLLMSFFAFDPGLRSGVRVGAGDVDGDGKADIIAGAGPGGGPHVRVFSGATGAEIRSFFAYDPGLITGLFVAGGDVNGDGKADIVTGPDQGGAPHVKVFSGADGSVLYSFFAYDPAFRGGVRVAAGDYDGDGKADVFTATGPGGGPHVKVFSGATGALLESFFAYDAGFTGGVFVGGR